MFSKINTFVISGARAFAVTVEADISRGIPDFEVVGLGSEAVREARKRVRAAIVNQGFSFPQSRVVLNLAPADIRKHGTSLDLPIAIGILSSAGVLPVYAAEKFSIIGELSLSGVIRPVKGIFSMVACGVKNGVKNFIVPYDNAEEAALAEGAAVYPVKSLAEAVRLLKGGPEDLPEGFLNGKNSYAYDQIGGNIADNICDEYEKYGDFSDVAGQNGAKRALEIAASGGHNILLLGSPGSGKTMLAERLGGIMPPMSFDELFEVLQIYSAAGMLDSFGHIWHRPFRKVSLGVTRAALIGGGKPFEIGEVSLSHNGVLFIDELAAVGRSALEALRRPLEEKKVRIINCGVRETVSADFLFVGASNPCPCGNLYEPSGRCCCSPMQIQNYLSKISSPILDRIDIHVPVRRVLSYQIESSGGADNSFKIRERVIKTRAIQTERFKNEAFKINGGIPRNRIEKYCSLTPNSRKLLRSAIDNMGISMRAYEKIVKVARTIADMDARENIKEDDIAEAMQYRCFDRGEANAA